MRVQTWSTSCIRPLAGSGRNERSPSFCSRHKQRCQGRKAVIHSAGSQVNIHAVTPPPLPAICVAFPRPGRACPIAHGAIACDAHAGTCGQREGSERSRPASVESSSAGRCTWHRSRHFWHSGEPWENICPAPGPTTSCVLHGHSRLATQVQGRASRRPHTFDAEVR